MKVRTWDFHANTPSVTYYTERSKTPAQETTKKGDWSVQACGKKFENLERGVFSHGTLTAVPTTPSSRASHKSRFISWSCHIPRGLCLCRHSETPTPILWLHYPLGDCLVLNLLSYCIQLAHEAKKEKAWRILWEVLWAHPYSGQNCHMNPQTCRGGWKSVCPRCKWKWFCVKLACLPHMASRT